MSGKSPGRRSPLTTSITVKATQGSDWPKSPSADSDGGASSYPGSGTPGKGWREGCKGQRNLLTPMQMGWGGPNQRGLCLRAGELSARSPQPSLTRGCPLAHPAEIRLRQQHRAEEVLQGGPAADHHPLPAEKAGADLQGGKRLKFGGGGKDHPPSPAEGLEHSSLPPPWAERPLLRGRS